MDDSTPHMQHLNSLRNNLQRIVDELLEAPHKNAISLEEAKRRFEQNLMEQLDHDAISMDAEPVVTLQTPDGETREVSTAGAYERASEKIANEIATFADFERWFPVAILEMIDQGIIGQQEVTSENAVALAKLYRRNEAVLQKIKAARLRGDFAYERVFYPPQQIHSLSEMKTLSRNTNKKRLRINELIQKYCDTQLSDGAWVSHSLSDHRGRLDNLPDILGNIYIEDITREDMRRVRDTLEKLPPSRKKSAKYKDKTIDQILAMDYDKYLNIKTINTIVQSISSMFDWAIREGIIENNPAKGLSKKDTENPIDKRDCFTNEDIKKIFFSGDFTPERFKNPAFFWVPLIGLYTGMRLEEICQLACEDIYREEDGI